MFDNQTRHMRTRRAGRTVAAAWRCAMLLAMVIAVAGCGGGSDSDEGPVTWSLDGPAPAPAMITGGPWTVAQLAAGNPNPPAVPNKSYGYGANFMTANAGSTSPMQPYYFPFIFRDGNVLQGYFDWRPKDINEAIVAASSSDDGQTWDFQQMALILTEAIPRNPQSTNPDASLVDNGFGHPTVIRFDHVEAFPTPSPRPGFEAPTPIHSKTFLYTVDRSTDALHKSGLVVTPLSPFGDMPLNGAELDIPLLSDFTDENRVIRTTGLLNPDGILVVVPDSSPVTVLYIQKIGNGDATGSTTLPGSQQCGTQPYVPVGASAPNPPFHDLVNVRVAVTYNGIDFFDQGIVAGLNDQRATSYTGTRWIAPNGTMLNLGGGRYGLFFAGGNCMDDDADAFHYVGYAESLEPSMQVWTVLNDIMNPIVSIGPHTVPVDGVPTLIPAQTPVVGPALHPFEARVYAPSVIKLDDYTVLLTFAGYHVQNAKDDPLGYRSIQTVRLKASRRL